MNQETSVPRTILITGATDGIGLATAKTLVKQGHQVLLHGRNPEKLKQVESQLSALGTVESYLADLYDLKAVESLAKEVANKHSSLDVLINNAGVLQVPNSITPDGLDVRFAVNTIAPYLLTQELLPLMGAEGRVVNVSSAAQAPVNLMELSGECEELEMMYAYSQSKLAIVMWSYAMAHTLGQEGPVVVAVNPGSMLASKMVLEGFGVTGNDIQIGADILTHAALSEEFAQVSGQYFDNDLGRFVISHPDALDLEKCKEVVRVIGLVLDEIKNKN